MTQQNLENTHVRFEARENGYFFARNLDGKQNVIDAFTSPRKFNKFVRQVLETFGSDTTMSNIWEKAIACKIKVDHSSY